MFKDGDQGIVGGEFARTFRHAIADRGVSLSWLHRRLVDAGTPVSVATLSYWRSGVRQPESAASLRAVDTLEELLWLDEGRLATLAGSKRRTGSLTKPRIPLSEDDLREQAALVAQKTASTSVDNLREISTELIVEATADGFVRAVRTRTVTQAVRLPLFELPYIWVNSGDADGAGRVYDTVGCSLDRMYEHESGRVWGFVLKLDAPIDVGETGMFEFTLARKAPERSGQPMVWHGVTRPSKQVLIRVNFPEDSRPIWAEEFEETSPVGEVVTPRVVRGSSLEVHRHGFGPGRVGVRWKMDTER